MALSSPFSVPRRGTIKFKSLCVYMQCPPRYIITVIILLWEVGCPMLTKYYKRYVPHERNKSRKRSQKPILTNGVGMIQRWPSSIVIVIQWHESIKTQTILLLLLHHIMYAIVHNMKYVCKILLCYIIIIYSLLPRRFFALRKIVTNKYK